MRDAATAFNDAVIAEYRRLVGMHGSATEHAERGDMFALAAERIQARIHSGEISVPVEDAIHAALISADARDGRSSDAVLSRLARGEIGLNIWPDPMLDQVVILGGGRRKTWRHVTPDDLAAMVELRRHNTNAARRSERRFLRDVDAVYSELVTAGTVGSMVEAARAAA